MIKRFLVRIALYILRANCRKQPYCDNCILFDKKADICTIYNENVRDLYLPDNKEDKHENI